MGCNISDEEFEAHLITVYEMWEDGFDTIDIARRIGITEAKVDCILACYLEGKFHELENAKCVLAECKEFDPVEILSGVLA